MIDRPKTVPLTLIFINLNAIIWLALGLTVASQSHPALPDVPLIRWVMAGLSFAASVILFGLVVFLVKRSRIAWFGAVGFLGLTALLAIFDDFGWADLLVLVINIIPIILLITERAWYLHTQPGAA